MLNYKISQSIESIHKNCPPILKFLLHFCKIDDESELSRSRVEQFGIFSSISPAQPPHYSTLHPRQANTRTKQPIWFSLHTPTRPLLLHGDIVIHSTHTSAITPPYLETSHSLGLKMWKVPSLSLLEYFWYILYLEMLSWNCEIIPETVKNFLECENLVFETVIFFCWNRYSFFWNSENFFLKLWKAPALSLQEYFRYILHLEKFSDWRCDKVVEVQPRKTFSFKFV